MILFGPYGEPLDDAFTGFRVAAKATGLVHTPEPSDSPASQWEHTSRP